MGKLPWGKVESGGEGPGGCGCQGDTGKEVVMGYLLSTSSSFPKLLPGDPSQAGPGRQIPAPLVTSDHLAQGMRLGLPIPRSHSGVGGQAEGCGCRGLGPASHTAHGIEPVLQRSEVCKWGWGRCWAWGGGCRFCPWAPRSLSLMCFCSFSPGPQTLTGITVSLGPAHPRGGAEFPE